MSVRVQYRVSSRTSVTAPHLGQNTGSNARKLVTLGDCARIELRHDQRNRWRRIGGTTGHAWSGINADARRGEHAVSSDEAQAVTHANGAGNDRADHRRAASRDRER